MAKAHGERFLQIVDRARVEIRECTIEEMCARRAAGDSFLLLDVREESEFAAGRIPGARHLGKGVIERDIEEVVLPVPRVRHPQKVRLPLQQNRRRHRPSQPPASIRIATHATQS